MSSEFFNDTNGNLWWADFDQIIILLRMWSQAKAYTETITVSEHNGLQELNLDQSRFRGLRETLHQREIGTVSENIYANPQNVFSHLVGRYQDIPRLEEQKRRQFNRVQSHNHQLIERRVTRGERTVAVLQFTRDVSAAIFMCCIPVAGLELGPAMALRLAGSVFQGISNYEDTGNAASALATGVFSFKSSLLGLPESANRAAQIIFTIVNTGNQAVANSAISMLTVNDRSATTFTNVLRGELISGGFDIAATPILSAVNSRLDGNVLPIAVETLAGRGVSAAAGATNDALPQPAQSTTQTPNQTPPNSGNQPANAARIRQELLRRSSQAHPLQGIENTPFYRYLLTGDENQLLSRAQQYVMGNLLRRGT